MPFITTGRYLKIEDNMTISINVLSVAGGLISRTLATNALVARDLTNLTFNASMCLLPNFNIE